MARTAVNQLARVRNLALVAVVLGVLAVGVNVRHVQWMAEQKRTAAQPPGVPVSRPAADDDSRQMMALTQHLARQPQDRDARLRLAHLYFRKFDYARALAELQTLERAHPRDPELRLRKATVLKYDRQPDRAEREIRAALALRPDDPLAEELLGQVHMDQRRYRDALKVFERRLKEQPESVQSLLGKGRALEQLYLAQNPVKVEEILAPVEKAARLAPEDPEVLATAARLKFAFLQGEKAHAEAEKLAARAVELDPRYAQPYITLAQIYMARPPTPENLQKVGEHAAQAGMLDLQDPRPPYLIGRISLLQNDIERAIKALEHSLRLQPLPETVTQLAIAYRRAGKAEQADRYSDIYRKYSDQVARRDTLLAARERAPKEVRHYHDLAALYLESGQPEKAEQWLKQARTLRPSDPAGDRLAVRARQLRERGGDGPLLAIR